MAKQTHCNYLAIFFSHKSHFWSTTCWTHLQKTTCKIKTTSLLCNSVAEAKTKFPCLNTSYEVLISLSRHLLWGIDFPVSTPVIPVPTPVMTCWFPCLNTWYPCFNTFYEGNAQARCVSTPVMSKVFKNKASNLDSWYFASSLILHKTTYAQWEGDWPTEILSEHVRYFHNTRIHDTFLWLNAIDDHTAHFNHAKQCNTCQTSLLSWWNIVALIFWYISTTWFLPM